MWDADNVRVLFSVYNGNDNDDDDENDKLTVFAYDNILLMCHPHCNNRILCESDRANTDANSL